MLIINSVVNTDDLLTGSGVKLFIFQNKLPAKSIVALALEYKTYHGFFFIKLCLYTLE